MNANNNNINDNPGKMKKRKNPYARSIFLSFSSLLLIGFLIAVIYPLRPKFSESEKRELTHFPKFSFSALADGSFFSGVSTWYSDTFPFRESFIRLSDKIKSFHGVGDSISSLTPDIIDTDIPEYSEPAENEDSEEEEEEETNATVEDNAPHNAQNLGSILVVDDAGYEYYNFVKSSADRYIKLVNETTAALKGTSTVYDILIPNSMAITLPDSVAKKINTGNQKDAIEYYFTGIKDDTKKVRIFNTLRNHRGEYIYFRTDHHWTALGAYYAYTEFTKKSGLKTAELTDFYEKEFPDFVGSFYYDANKNSALMNNPDTVYAYDPKGNVTLQYTDRKGQVVDWYVVADVSDWVQNGKYNCFIGSDNPYCHIVDNGKTEKRSCIVIKESYGNAFVPFLTANYSEIHVIDYRYWHGSIANFAKQNSVDDVIFINNISSIRSSDLMSQMESITP